MVNFFPDRATNPKFSNKVCCKLVKVRLLPDRAISSTGYAKEIQSTFVISTSIISKRKSGPCFQTEI